MRQRNAESVSAISEQVTYNVIKDKAQKAAAKFTRTFYQNIKDKVSSLL